MKRILINFINLYKRIPLKSHTSCKYIPTCSNYAIEAIDTYGSIKGSYLTIKRILRCNPFSKGGYDPVPLKEKKMKKITKLIILIIVVLSTTTGCFKSDEMENINIITTVYPIEYILTKLYGTNSVINSIYPDGVNIYEYKFSQKEYKDFSKQKLFVYNGLSDDKDIAIKLLNKNKNLLIIDTAFGMEIEYGIEELWLNPSNLLMMSRNVKNGLSELIESNLMKEEINEKYNELKVVLSELDADIKGISEQASNNTIIVSSPTLMYLKKYGFNVILISDDKENSKNYSTALELINDKKIKYIYALENDEESKALAQIKKETKVELIELDRLDNMTDEERDNKKDYISLMQANIELLRKGVK